VERDCARHGIGLTYRQQHSLPDAERTIPELLIHLDNKTYLCDVTVTWPTST
jgi:hypothetical protein